MFPTGAVISQGAVILCFFLLLHKVDLLDLSACDKHLQRVEKKRK